MSRANVFAEKAMQKMTSQHLKTGRTFAVPRVQGHQGRAGPVRDERQDAALPEQAQGLRRGHVRRGPPPLGALP